MTDDSALLKQLTTLHSAAVAQPPLPMQARLQRLSSILDRFPPPGEAGHYLLTMVAGESPHWRHLGNSTFSVGRLAACDLQIPRKEVSQRHCEFSFDGEDWEVRDLGSTNGTRVNGDTVSSRLLRQGDAIQVGNCLFVYLRVLPA